MSKELYQKKDTLNNMSNNNNNGNKNNNKKYKCPNVKIPSSNNRLVCEYDKQKYCLKAPDNEALDFFAYGFYKPDQIAFHSIKDYVSKVEKVKIKKSVGFVNGIPVLMDGYNDMAGWIIRFNNNDKHAAYEIIGNCKRIEFYKWEKLTVNNEKVNVLMPNKNDIQRFVTGYSQDYDWKNDDSLKRSMEYLSKNIPRNVKFFIDYNDEEFLKLQMLYLLLWSVIDRFTNLRYGFNVTDNITELSKEDYFKDALKNNFNKTSTVFSVQNLKSFTLQPKKPVCSIKYYYTFRNNIIHNGKDSKADAEKLHNALIELFDIFNEVYEEVKKEDFSKDFVEN